MKLTVKYILTIILSFACATLFSQETPSGKRSVDMDALHGKTRNSSSAVEWIDKENFIYFPEEDGQKTYYLVGTRTWKPSRMFDNTALCDDIGDYISTDFTAGILKTLESYE